MLPRPQGIFFFKVARAACVAAIILPFCSSDSSNSIKAAESQSHILARVSISSARLKDLAAKLRRITGWSDLDFDRNGGFQGGLKAATGGSKTAREFVATVMRGPTVVVLEDASRSSEVAFCRVSPGRWANNPETQPDAYVVQIDFSDFEQVTGDKRALAAFGWLGIAS